MDLQEIQATAEALRKAFNKVGIEGGYRIINEAYYGSVEPFAKNVGDTFYCYVINPNYENGSKEFKVKLLDNWYVEFEDGDSAPIEDLYPVWFSKNQIAEQQAFDECVKRDEQRFAEAYHKDKAEGKETELTRAVEQLLQTKDSNV